MTNPNKTQIVVVLDRSGSMRSVLKDTIGGFNAFLAEQKKQAGEANISLTQFDNLFEAVYEDVPLAHVKDLDETTYVPRGGTALLDAIGRTINSTGSRLAALPENDRPGKVIVVIMTDGEENSSREFTCDRIFEMIKHQREKYSWDFAFIGANQDAIGEASKYGIPQGAALNYTSNSQGTQDAFQNLSRSVARYRSGAVRGHNLFAADAAQPSPAIGVVKPDGTVDSLPKITVK